MNKPIVRITLILLMLFVITLACRAFAGDESENPQEVESQPVEESPIPVEQGDDTLPTEEDTGQEGSEPYDTEFPLPGDVQNFMLVPQFEGGINYQTDLTLDEVVSFYRNEFVSQGLTENTLLTVIDDTTFSIVFIGAQNGMAIVIQGVVIGPDQTNVNLRYEDL